MMELRNHKLSAKEYSQPYSGIAVVWANEDGSKPKAFSIKNGVAWAVLVPGMYCIRAERRPSGIVIRASRVAQVYEGLCDGSYKITVAWDNVSEFDPFSGDYDSKLKGAVEAAVAKLTNPGRIFMVRGRNGA
jgi:hypothetical protein